MSIFEPVLGMEHRSDGRWYVGVSKCSAPKNEGSPSSILEAKIASTIAIGSVVSRVWRGFVCLRKLRVFDFSRSSQYNNNNNHSSNNKYNDNNHTSNNTN